MLPESRLHDYLHDYQLSLWVAFDEPRPENVYHYTSLTAMRGILGAKSIWATDVRYTNDLSEGNYAWTVLVEALREREDLLSAALLENFEGFGGLPGFGTEWFRYAVCFCRAKDLLSQWRSYTPAGAGVALETPFGALVPYSGVEFALIRLLYDPEEQVHMVHRMLNHAVALWQDSPPQSQPEADAFLGAVGYELIEIMLRFKHPDFSAEQEWRVLLLNRAEEHALLPHHERGGQEVPYAEIAFRPEYLQSVIIGPGPHSVGDAKVRAVLEEFGLGHVRIERSAIPLRG
jgi:hypothetical protein